MGDPMEQELMRIGVSLPENLLTTLSSKEDIHHVQRAYGMLSEATSRITNG